MSPAEALQNIEFNDYFPTARGWEMKIIKSGDVDKRSTRQGDPIRCSDLGYGITPDGGFESDVISRGPSIPGAIRGLSNLYPRIPTAYGRMAAAVNGVRLHGFEPADHGFEPTDHVSPQIADSLRDLGCYYSTLDRIPGEQMRPLRSMFDIEHVVLQDPRVQPKALLLNGEIKTTVLQPGDFSEDPSPEAVRLFSPIDVWLPLLMNISPKRVFGLIAAYGEEILPPDRRILYIVR